MEQTIEQRRLAFLEETVTYYSEDTNRRAVSDIGACYYRVGDKKCAIGRHIPDNSYTKEIEGCSIDSALVYSVLPKEVQELGIAFLVNVQSLHDDRRYWGNQGLTPVGKEKANEIMLAFCQPEPVM